MHWLIKLFFHYYTIFVFYTGRVRSASELLAKQSKKSANEKKAQDTLVKMVGLAHDMKVELENNNLEGFADYPGALGAKQAIWKGVAEWGAQTHGTGGGDSTQGNIGDGGANFDPFWAGETTAIGQTNMNIVSAITSCGAVAFTETPINDETFAQHLLQHAGVKVLPGRYLARDTAAGNPGEHRVRLALVAELGQCVEAAERIAHAVKSGG